MARGLKEAAQGLILTDGKLPVPGTRSSRLNKSAGALAACSHSELCIGEFSFLQQKPL